MPTDTTVNNLVINKLTKAQYDAIQNPSDTELYLVPDVIDTTPTSGSNNMVTSGGVYDALSNKADTSDIPTVPTALSAFTDDLGSSPTHTHSQYLTSAPVTSVNGQTGAVSLTIPAAVTESTVSGWGFTKNTGNVGSTTVSSIVTLTEAQYEALSTKDSSTLYIITSS